MRLVHQSGAPAPGCHRHSMHKAEAGSGPWPKGTGRVAEDEEGSNAETGRRQ